MPVFRPIVISIQLFATAFVLLAWLSGDASWLGTTLAVGLGVGLLSAIANSDNLLFFARTVFIVWIGLIPPLALYLGGYFAWRMPFVQTMNVAFVMTIITTLAIFSSQVGIELGKRIRVRMRGLDMKGTERKLFLFLLLLLLVVGTLISMRRGDLVFASGYVSPAQQASRVQIPVQNLQSTAVLLALFALVLLRRMEALGKLSASRDRGFRLLLWFGILYVAIWCQFLRGARMDPLTLIFALVVLYQLYKNNELRLTIKVLTYLVLAFSLLQVWGGLRHNPQDFDGTRIVNIVENLYAGSTRDGVPIYFRQGTMNNLSLSVATVIYAIDKGDAEYRFGETYMDYIARTPPEFLYPDRPESLAWLSADLYGGGGAGGGFNEMAESYLNFGVFGSLIVPGVISFLLSYSFRQFMVNRYSILSSLLFLSMLAVLFRGLLYQTFTFYKTFVTALILYGLLILMVQFLLVPSKGRSRRRLDPARG